MRRRSTYIHDPSLDVPPNRLQVKGAQFLVGALKAAREERLTFGFDELPPELLEVLQLSHELHIRWASESPFNTTAPFLSRLSPGLHVHYTPLKQRQNGLLCPFLQKAFSQEMHCHSPETSFIRPPLISERFASTSSWQYYSPLGSLSNLVAYIQRHVCVPSDISCLHTASLLNIVDALDFDYDSISHALLVTAFWSKPPAVFYDPIGEFTTYDAWNIDIKAESGDKVEVGILSSSPPTDAHDLQLSGFLTVVGEDDHPKATLFSFPSRHHSLTASQASAQRYDVSFLPPTGLHPTLQISFPSASSLIAPTTRPAGSVCALHAYLTLPSFIFADKYAFLGNDPLFQESHHLGQLRSISGETDLEAPDYVVRKWGSTMLLELGVPDSGLNQTTPTLPHTWDVTIPLHLRYLPPADGGQSVAQVPWPVVFWACTAEEGTKFPVNPFDRTQLGYDGLFGPRTMFYHLEPAPIVGTKRPLVEKITIPVLDTKSPWASAVELVTAVAILSGFCWVLMRLAPALSYQIGLRRDKGHQKKTQ